MHGLLTVEGPGDWERLRRRNLTTIIDPTVLRVADLFFAGGCGLTPAARDRVWQIIEAEAGALMTFVDAVLLWDEIPLFGAPPPPERGPLADVFQPVRVVGVEYRQCRATAVSRPDLVRGPAARGEQLFDTYADRLSCDGQPPALRVLRPATGAAAFPNAPTFLPLLLQEDDILTPEHLAERLLLWRTTHAVRDYRAWLVRLRKTLVRGQPADGLATDLADLADRTGNGVGLDVMASPAGCHQRLRFRPATPQRDLTAQLRRVWCG